MTLPEQFKEENLDNIRIYHYVEELIVSFKGMMTKSLEDYDISLSEAPFLIRIRFAENSTQQDLAEIFHVSKGYTAKLMSKYEDKGLITRVVDSNNKRRKIVNLTEKGIKKTDELIEFMDQWELAVVNSLSDDEITLLKQLLFKITIEGDKL